MSMVLPARGAEVEAVCGEAEWTCHPSGLCHGKPYSLPALPGEYAGPCQYGARRFQPDLALWRAEALIERKTKDELFWNMRW